MALGGLRHETNDMRESEYQNTPVSLMGNKPVLCYENTLMLLWDTGKIMVILMVRKFSKDFGNRRFPDHDFNSNIFGYFEF